MGTLLGKREDLRVDNIFHFTMTVRIYVAGNSWVGGGGGGWRVIKIISLILSKAISVDKEELEDL